MDRSRSPRNLSDEARLLQRLEEVELPPGATDAERAATRAEAAVAVQQAANEVGWARAYQELHPDWQPTLTDIEVSNERARELALANEVMQALSTTLRAVYSVLNDFDLSSDEARRRLLLYLHRLSTSQGWGWAAPPQQPTLTDNELTAARAELAAARAEITRLSAGITAARDELSHGIHEARARLDRVGPEFGIDAYFVVVNHMEDVQIGLARLQPTTLQGTRSRPEAMTQQPFTGQGHRLGE